MAIPELPSVGFYDRLTNAMQAWERARGRVGQRGNQTLIVTRMQELFGENAPAPAAMSQWLRRETVAGPDGAFMLAYALDVRPEWLCLGLGEMRDDEDQQGAEKPNGNPKPRYPIVETPVQYLDPNKPTAPSRAKPKPAPKKPGRSAIA